MGSVGLAVREEGAFRRVYAIKRLLPEYRRDERVRSMFMDEARIAGLLHHPNIVSVVDVGEDEDGPYLVMDYVQGVPLAAIIGAAREDEKLVPIQIAARIIRDVAEGLDASHELVAHDGTKLELVHRDVSPQNVLVGYDGIARLTDFGIAKALGRQQRTTTGILKGKFGYFAPERLRFQEPTRLSDIFSLGVVFHETLSGQRLYDGADQTEIARRILEDPPPDIGFVRNDVHPTIVELLLRMLARKPERRPQTAHEVARCLDSVLLDIAAEEGQAFVPDYVTDRFADLHLEQMQEVDDLTAAVELHRPSRPTPWFRRSRGRVGAALVALVVAGALGIWLMLDRSDAFTETGDSSDTQLGSSEGAPVAAKQARAQPSASAEAEAPEVTPQEPVAEVPKEAPAAKAKPQRSRTTRNAKRGRASRKATKTEAASTERASSALMDWER